MSVTLTHREQLIALFAGELCEGEWVTTPFYDHNLAVEICRTTDPASLTQLHQQVFGIERAKRPAELPEIALIILGRAYERWRAIRLQQQGNRGL